MRRVDAGRVLGLRIPRILDLRAEVVALIVRAGKRCVAAEEEPAGDAFACSQHQAGVFRLARIAVLLDAAEGGVGSQAAEPAGGIVEGQVPVEQQFLVRRPGIQQAHADRKVTLERMIEGADRLV